jgi:hypothetical protein
LNTRHQRARRSRARQLDARISRDVERHLEILGAEPSHPLLKLAVRRLAQGCGPRHAEFHEAAHRIREVAVLRHYLGEQHRVEPARAGEGVRFVRGDELQHRHEVVGSLGTMPAPSGPAWMIRRQ